MFVAWLVACVLTAVVGWILNRFAHVKTAGVVLWCLATAALITATLSPKGDLWPISALCALMAVILFVASSIVFLVAAMKDRTRRRQNCAGCTLAAFTLIAWFVGLGVIGDCVRCQEHLKSGTETLMPLNKLGIEIESLRKRLGRLPRDEEELVSLRGTPMPPYYQELRLHYSRLDEEHYELRCVGSWIVYYYGPNSPRRIKLESF
jgi:hypothetical protein